MKLVKTVACLMVLVLIGGIVGRQQAGQDKADKNTLPPLGPPTITYMPKPASHKVEKKPFRIERTVAGTLSAEETAEISYRPHAATQGAASHGFLTIRTLAEQGARVKPGDPLAALDTTRISEEIDQLQVQKKVLQSGVEHAEQELVMMEKAMPAELAIAEAASKRAHSELKYFVETGRAQAEKKESMYVAMYKFYMEFAEDELRQLKKMYKANDLTEDTERMILRRQQFYVEYETFFYQAALIQREYLLKHTLPNRLKTLQEEQVKSDFHLEKLQKTAGPTVVQKRAALAKLRYDADRNNERLDRLMSDRAAMTITAPIEGIVYHGRFHKGTWKAFDAADSKLVAGGTLAPNEVFMTIVKPRPVIVYVDIHENDVHLFKTGLEGTAKMTAYPDRKLKAKLVSLSTGPVAPGKFAGQVRVELGAENGDLLPGMACWIKFVPYVQKAAIVIPINFIHEEDNQHHVYVAVGGKPQPEKREVRVGHQKDYQVEILSGLREGEIIVPEGSLIH